MRKADDNLDEIILGLAEEYWLSDVIFSLQAMSSGGVTEALHEAYQLQLEEEIREGRPSDDEVEE